MEAVIAQLDKLSSNRFELQSAVLELKQRNVDLLRNADQQPSSSSGISEIHVSIFHTNKFHNFYFKN